MQKWNIKFIGKDDIHEVIPTYGDKIKSQNKYPYKDEIRVIPVGVDENGYAQYNNVPYDVNSEIRTYYICYLACKRNGFIEKDLPFETEDLETDSYLDSIDGLEIVRTESDVEISDEELDEVTENPDGMDPLD